MATSLSLDALAEMKKAEFLKAFKNKAVWKKAKAAIILVDYKLDGKKTTVAVPFKKVADMKQEVKRLKAEKLHLLKKTAGCLLTLKKGEDGLPLFEANIRLGGIAPELLEAKVSELFSKIKVGFKVLTPTKDTIPVAENSETTTDQTSKPKRSLKDSDKAKMKENIQIMKANLAKLKSQLNIA